MTRSEKMLRMMKKRGGMRFSEIVKQFVEWAGHDWDEMTLAPSFYNDPKGCWSKSDLADLKERYGKPKKIRRWRSFWSDNLLGGVEPDSRQGLLKRFCKKGKGRNGEWRVIRPIKPPFVPVNRR